MDADSALVRVRDLLENGAPHSVREAVNILRKLQRQMVEGEPYEPVVMFELAYSQTLQGHFTLALGLAQRALEMCDPERLIFNATEHPIKKDATELISLILKVHPEAKNTQTDVDAFLESDEQVILPRDTHQRMVPEQ